VQLFTALELGMNILQGGICLADLAIAVGEVFSDRDWEILREGFTEIKSHA